MPQAQSSLPSLPQRLLERSLLARLDQCFSHALTLLAAPAGFGKSTLVLQWLQQRDQPVIWLSLNVWHNQPRTFWGAVIKALQTVDPHLGKTTQSYLQLPDLPPPETYLSPLLDELMQLSQTLVWVLDDFQVLENTELQNAVAQCLLAAPPHLHVLVCTRQSPLGLPISRLRGRQQLLEITTSDLCFSAAETQVLLQQNGFDLSPEMLAQVYGYTEGWPWCVQLLMRYLEQTPTGLWAVQQSQQHRLDYLIDEVFSDLSRELQDVLLQLSVFTAFDARLCAAVTGYSDTVPLLTQLEVQQVFVRLLDPINRTYCLHPLMAEVLSQRLQGQAREQRQQLHERAMQWFTEQGEYAQAIAHGLQAQAFDAVAALIVQQAYTMMAQGQIVQLGNWIDGLPEGVVAASEELKAFKIWVLVLTHRLEQAQNHLEQLAEKGPHYHNLWATLARKRGDFPRVIAHSHKALEIPLGVYSPFIHNFIQGTAWFNLGIAYLGQQAFAQSMQAFESSLPFQHAIHNLLTALAARVCQARIYLYQGLLEQAQFLYQQALQDAEQWHLGKHSIVGTVWLEQALIAHYQGDKDSCLSLLHSGLQQTTAAYNSDSIYGFKLALELYCRMQAWEQASECLMRAEGFARKQGYLQLLADLDAFRRWVWFGKKQWHVLETHYQLDRPLTSAIDALVQIRYELQRYQAAPSLPQLLPYAHQRPAIGLEILLLEAQLLQGPRQMAASLAKVEQAIALARKHQLVGIWREYDVLRPMVQTALKQFSLGEQLFLGKVWPDLLSSEHLEEPLSSREIELLHLINQGFSNQALADHFVVTLNTIKTHLKNIFRKLDVSSRTQAIAKARQLHLMDDLQP